MAALRDHRRVQAAARLALGAAYQDRGLVFCREDGEPIHPERLTVMFRRHVAAADLPPIRLHDLRHTHASLLMAAGVHPKVVQERLGHHSSAYDDGHLRARGRGPGRLRRRRPSPTSSTADVCNPLARPVLEALPVGA